MKFFRSIRTRLALWFSVWLAAILIAFGGGTYLFIRSILFKNLDHSLRNQVTWLQDFIKPRETSIRPERRRFAGIDIEKNLQKETPISENAEDEIDEIDSVWQQIYEHTILHPQKQFIQIQRTNGEILYQSPPSIKKTFIVESLPGLKPVVSTLSDEIGDSFRVAIGRTEHIRVLVAYPMREMDEVLENLFSLYVLLAPIALIVALTGGWFLADRSLRPVDSITKAVRHITLKNLGQTLPVYNAEDELGRLSATFNEMIGRLKTSVEKMQRFAGDASHELRTPLTIMRGEVEVALRNTKLTRPVRKLLTSMHEELVRLSAIVEGLMLLIKSDAGRMTFQFEEIRLDNLIADIAKDAALLAKPKHITVSLERNDSSHILGDDTRLRQLFRNLIDNAVNYTPVRGSISLSLIRSNGKAIVSIADTGIGISKRDLSKIFERFFRSQSGESISSSGSGLGLSIAKWIAEAHEANIIVTSQPRKGSTFVVEIPLAPLEKKS